MPEVSEADLSRLKKTAPTEGWLRPDGSLCLCRSFETVDLIEDLKAEIPQAGKLIEIINESIEEENEALSSIGDDCYVEGTSSQEEIREYILQHARNTLHQKGWLRFKPSLGLSMYWKGSPRKRDNELEFFGYPEAIETLKQAGRAVARHFEAACSFQDVSRRLDVYGFPTDQVIESIRNGQFFKARNALYEERRKADPSGVLEPVEAFPVRREQGTGRIIEDDEPTAEAVAPRP